jgi:uncharacterized protein (TIGR03437 family)
MGYSAADVAKQTAVFNSTPNGWGGSFWNSGRGLSADNQGNIYAVTANGDSDEATEYGDNVLKLEAGSLKVTDWFAPSDVQVLDVQDSDLGSSGVVLVPGTNQVVTGGKEGIVYLLDAGSLGHQSANDAQIPQVFSAARVGIFNMALWNRTGAPILYLLGGDAPIAAYSFRGNQIDTTASSQSSSPYSVPFSGMTVSSNGGTPGSGILWVTTADNDSLPSTGTLHAFSADDLSSELWNSSINSDRDFLGTFTKFANPTVASGKVYVPTVSNALAVYGALDSQTVGGPAPAITGLVNAASYATGSVAPGEIVAIFGQNLGPQRLVTGSFDGNGNLGTQLAGVQATFNGVPAPLLYASSFVIAVVVPFEIASASQTDVVVSYNGTPSVVQTFPVAPSAPGIFTRDSSGSGEAAILNQDFSLNSEANPATAGSVIAIYATGGGMVDPPDATGALAQGIAQLTSPVTATIGGEPAQVLYAGHAPGEISGVFQVNLLVPDGISGDAPVVLTIGGAMSQTTATVAVQ